MKSLMQLVMLALTVTTIYVFFFTSWIDRIILRLRMKKADSLIDASEAVKDSAIKHHDSMVAEAKKVVETVKSLATISHGCKVEAPEPPSAPTPLTRTIKPAKQAAKKAVTKTARKVATKKPTTK